MLYFDDSEYNYIVSKLHKVRRKRRRFSCLLGLEGGGIRTSGRFYVAVVQSILVFGSELWVIMPLIMKAMRSLHNQVAHRISV